MTSGESVLRVPESNIVHRSDSPSSNSDQQGVSLNGSCHARIPAPCSSPSHPAMGLEPTISPVAADTSRSHQGHRSMERPGGLLTDVVTKENGHVNHPKSLGDEVAAPTLIIPSHAVLKTSSLDQISIITTNLSGTADKTLYPCDVAGLTNAHCVQSSYHTQPARRSPFKFCHYEECPSYGAVIAPHQRKCYYGPQCWRGHLDTILSILRGE